MFTVSESNLTLCLKKYILEKIKIIPKIHILLDNVVEEIPIPSKKRKTLDMLEMFL